MRTRWSCEGCDYAGHIEHASNAGIHGVVRQIDDAHRATSQVCHELNGNRHIRVTIDVSAPPRDTGHDCWCVIRKEDCHACHHCSAGGECIADTRRKQIGTPQIIQRAEDVTNREGNHGNG